MAERALPMPETLLADAFAEQVAHWARTGGATPQAERATAHAARRLSLAASGGDVCLPLAEIESHVDWPSDPRDARALLEASTVVGTPHAPGSLPLILDDGGRLYLHRDFDHERQLARRILALRATPLASDDTTPRLRDAIARIFDGNAAGAGPGPDWQRIAVAMALMQRFTVVSGGPGTGKTTTIVHLIACLLAAQPGLRIALAAPTGKAAARMTEAIRGRAAVFAADLQSRLPEQAFTVHRLLGMRGSGQGPEHHARHPLPCDLLVVDEASMLDLALARHLFDAVPPSARVVLLGDKDQLASVESGAVFADLCGGTALSPDFRQQVGALAGVPAQEIRPPESPVDAPLTDTAVWFTRSLRFADDSGIGRLAAAIRAGDASAASACLRDGTDAALGWIEAEGIGPDAALERHAISAFRPYFEAVLATPRDPGAVSAAFGQFRLLCALRDGPRGVSALNEVLTRALRARLTSSRAADASAWFPGRPVMVLRNDYLLNLFNGDIGIALPDDDGGLSVWFPRADGGFRAVPPARMPPHETAFAMTVHKSQGSEFDTVMLVLPSRPSRVLTRELLYTGVTRARTRVLLAGTDEVLRAAVQSRTQRRSGLAARLREEALSGHPAAFSPAISA